MKRLDSQGLVMGLAAALYLLVVHLTMGLRAEHFVLAGFVLFCYFSHPLSRDFILKFMPFTIYGIFFDFIRLVPHEWAGTVHIEGPYRLEAALFSWLGFGPNFLPTEYFLDHHHIFVDVFSAVMYSLHIIIPIVFALYLWWNKSSFFYSFRWAFFSMNLVAGLVWIAFPVTPPWYVTHYGMENLGWDIPSVIATANLVRVDELIGFAYFQGVYSKGAWIYGAIPSMHAGCSLLTALFSLRSARSFSPWLFAYAIGVSFAAVYLNHHYVIDLIVGWSFALTAFLVYLYTPVWRPATLRAARESLDRAT